MILIGIPTRGRPEYLAALLSSILFQKYVDYDVLIVDTASDGEKKVWDSTIATRFIHTIRGLGHRVDVVDWFPSCGRSEAAAVNYILHSAKNGNYDLVFKVDDDHVLEPTCLQVMSSAYYSLPTDKKAILSGVTPWMYCVRPGCSSPYDKKRCASTLGEYVSYLKQVDDDIEVVINHFDRYLDNFVARTQIASAANFMLKPDINCLWSDVSQSSFYLDAMWFLRLRHFFDYEFFFHLGVNVWHVAAESGGVRTEEGNLEKNGLWDKHNFEILREMAFDYKELL